MGVSHPTSHEYEPVIGLEIHVQLATRTKMFCGCALSFGDPANVHTCPVCLGLPGTLPVVNARAIHFGILIGLALGCEIAPRSEFHRKNYFYPDLPKGYQISQYDVPLCRGGELGDVRIHRVHLEEDAAKLVHQGESGRIHGAETSVVDFNRGGTPLVEIVTEPDLRSAAQAREWLGLLRTTLRQLGVSNVNMEEGSLRCDANVSIRPVGRATFGTKTELKNMNSFRFIERGIDAEIARQEALVAAGEEVVGETLHFDPASGRISSLRSKEEAHDYRYFPEPDLVPLERDDFMTAARVALAEKLPLPLEKAESYEHELGLSHDRAREIAFRPDLADFFDEARTDADARAVANFLQGVVQEVGDRDLSTTLMTPAALGELVEMVHAKQVSRDAARQVISRLLAEGGDPRAIVEAEGLGAVGGADELVPVVREALAAQPDAADKLRAGQMKAIGPIIGHVMRATKGRADGGEVTRLVRAELGL